MSLEVQIKKRFPGFQLDARFECGGETLALLGASGSGKTLTLNCIAGVARPDEGRIVLDGRVLFDSQKRVNLSPQERGVGLLFQSYALFPNMTAEQNILCGLSRIRDRRERARRLDGLVEKLRLGGLEKRYPSQLSGGQQQRVALARLLGSEPGLLMLDEPFSALDEALKWQLEQELLEMLEEIRTPVLYITHDMREVRRLCDRACVLDAGRTQPAETPAAILERPRTMAAALLGGCENVAAAHSDSYGRAYVDEWRVALRCAVPLPEGIRAVAVRAARVGVGGGEENILPCEALRVLEDGDRYVAVCRPEGTRATIRAAWERGRDPFCRAGERVTLSIPPEAVQPLI